MKQHRIAGSTVLALAVSSSVAEAEPIIFDYTSSLVSFTVPTTDIFRIVAFGAQGANSSPFAGFVGAGGQGAEIGGTFNLTAGEILQIAVVGAGSGPGGGGGGSLRGWPW
jgi:hypothetical protein